MSAVSTGWSWQDTEVFPVAPPRLLYFLPLIRNIHTSVFHTGRLTARLVSAKVAPAMHLSALPVLLISRSVGATGKQPAAYVPYP